MVHPFFRRALIGFICFVALSAVVVCVVPISLGLYKRGQSQPAKSSAVEKVTWENFNQLTENVSSMQDADGLFGQSETSSVNGFLLSETWHSKDRRRLLVLVFERKQDGSITLVRKVMTGP